MSKALLKEVDYMAEKLFEVVLPEELVTGFGWREAEVPERIREALVMELLRLDRLSEAQAATILGLSRWQLVDLMGQHRVPAIRMNPKELKGEVAGANRQSE